MINHKKILNLLFIFSFTIIAILLSVPSNASVVLGGTRVIYNAHETEVTLKLNNVGKQPGLIQTWIDNGDEDALPADIDVPFIVTPALARIDPGKGQTLRIFRSEDIRVQDKESVFWLNVMEIPPESGVKEDSVNQINIAFRSRIKLFYRPAGLEGSAQETPSKIVWHLKQEGDKTLLIATNPADYHFSFSSLEIDNGQKRVMYEHGGMVPPGESMSLVLDENISPTNHMKVIYHAINDYGGRQDGETPITP